MPNGDIINSNIINNTLNITYRSNYFSYDNSYTSKLNNNLPIVINNNNEIIIGGTHMNDDTLDLNLRIYKYNNNGIIVTSFGNNGILDIGVDNNLDIINDIKLDINNNIYILGTTQPAGSDIVNYILLIYDTNGNFIKNIDLQNIDCIENGYLILNKNNNNFYLINYDYIYYLDNDGNVIVDNSNLFPISVYFLLDPITNNLLYNSEDTNKIQINEFDIINNNIVSKIIPSIVSESILAIYIDSNGCIYIKYDYNNNIYLLKLKSFDDPQILFNNLLYSIDINPNFNIINTDNNNNIYILSYYKNNKQIYYLLEKYDNNGNFIKQITIKLNDTYMYTNYGLNIDNNGNIFIDNLRTYISNNNYTVYDIYKINTNCDLDINFGTNGQITNDISNIIADPVDMFLTNDNNILLGGTTFLNNYDFALSKFDLFGNKDITFGDNGNKIINIQNNSIDIFFNINNFNDNMYILSGLSKNETTDNFILQFVIIDSTGNIIITIPTTLIVNNLYNVIKKNNYKNEYYIIYTDINNNYNIIGYTIDKYIPEDPVDPVDPVDPIDPITYSITNTLNNFDFGELNNPQFIFNNNFIMYNVGLLIIIDNTNTNIKFNICKVICTDTDCNLFYDKTFTFNINSYYTNTTDIKKINAVFNKYVNNFNDNAQSTIYKHNMYVSTIVNASNQNKLLLFNFIIETIIIDNTININISLDLTYNNNTGYVSNDNYNISLPYLETDQTNINDTILDLFTRNIMISKIDIDTTQNLMIGGTYKVDASGNNIFFMKLDISGNISACNISKKGEGLFIPHNYQQFNNLHVTNKNSGYFNNLNTFILTKFGEIIFSTNIINKPIYYINNTYIAKLNNNLKLITFQNNLSMTITYIDNNNYTINTTLAQNDIVIITVDELNRIYQLFYDMTNYPDNNLYTILLGNDIFKIYKEKVEITALVNSIVEEAISNLIRKLNPILNKQ